MAAARKKLIHVSFVCPGGIIDSRNMREGFLARVQQERLLGNLQDTTITSDHRSFRDIPEPTKPKPDVVVVARHDGLNSLEVLASSLIDFERQHGHKPLLILKPYPSPHILLQHILDLHSGKSHN